MCKAKFIGQHRSNLSLEDVAHAKVTWPRGLLTSHLEGTFYPGSDVNATLSVSHWFLPENLGKIKYEMFICRFTCWHIKVELITGCSRTNEENFWVFFSDFLNSSPNVLKSLKWISTLILQGGKFVWNRMRWVCIKCYWEAVHWKTFLPHQISSSV